MNRRHFILWMGSMGLAAATGNLLGKPPSLQAATLPPRRLPTPSPEPVLPARPPVTPLSLIYDRDYLLYQGPYVGSFGEGPTRLQAIVERLEAFGLPIQTHQVAPATVAQLQRAHTLSYIKYIQKATQLPQDEFAMARRVEKQLVNRPSGRSADASIASRSDGGARGAVEPFIPRFKSIVRYVPIPAGAPRVSKAKPYRAASLAAGGAVKAVDEVMSGQARASFALIRPPGHHARRARNMGFCIFNNAAVAARHAQAAHGAERVLIVDWDVHHGNGTQEIFYNDPSVLYFSTHQENIYPKRTGKLGEVGAGAGRGFNVNVPLPAHTGDDGFVRVFEEVLSPIARAFKPDLIIVSAGQDAHSADFVAQMRMSDAGFSKLTQIMQRLASDLCDNRLVFVLEGGYNPKAAARSVETICRVLNAPEPVKTPDDLVAGRPSPVLRSRIAQVRAVHQAHWPTLARSSSHA